VERWTRDAARARDLDVDRAVAAGLAWLDARLEPGWDERIDLDELDMNSSTRCVAAQALGVTWTNALLALGLNGGPTLRSRGFFHERHELLTEAWYAALHLRRVQRELNHRWTSGPSRDEEN
jgi:hypothetical protein